MQRKPALANAAATAGSLLGFVGGNMLGEAIGGSNGQAIGGGIAIGNQILTAINPVAGAVVGIASTAIGGLIAWEKKKKEEAIKKAVETYQKSLSKLETAKESDDKLKRHDELVQGVNSLGKNVSLTDDEYKEYQSLSNELAETFPELIVGFDSAGNALLGFEGQVGSVSEHMKEIVKNLEAQTARDFLTSGNLKNVYRDYKKDIKDNKDKKQNLSNDLTVMSIYPEFKRSKSYYESDFKEYQKKLKSLGVSYTTDKEWDNDLKHTFHIINIDDTQENIDAINKEIDRLNNEISKEQGIIDTKTEKYEKQIISQVITSFDPNISDESKEIVSDMIANKRNLGNYSEDNIEDYKLNVQSDLDSVDFNAIDNAYAKFETGYDTFSLSLSETDALVAEIAEKIANATGQDVTTVINSVPMFSEFKNLNDKIFEKYGYTDDTVDGRHDYISNGYYKLNHKYPEFYQMINSELSFEELKKFSELDIDKVVKIVEDGQLMGYDALDSIRNYIEEQSMGSMNDLFNTTINAIKGIKDDKNNKIFKDSTTEEIVDLLSSYNKEEGTIISQDGQTIKLDNRQKRLVNRLENFADSFGLSIDQFADSVSIFSNIDLNGIATITVSEAEQKYEKLNALHDALQSGGPISGELLDFIASDSSLDEAFFGKDGSIEKLNEVVSAQIELISSDAYKESLAGRYVMNSSSFFEDVLPEGTVGATSMQGFLDNISLLTGKTAQFDNAGAKELIEENDPNDSKNLEIMISNVKTAFDLTEDTEAYDKIVAMGSDDQQTEYAKAQNDQAKEKVIKDIINELFRLYSGEITNSTTINNFYNTVAGATGSINVGDSISDKISKVKKYYDYQDFKDDWARQKKNYEKQKRDYEKQRKDIIREQQRFDREVRKLQKQAEDLDNQERLNILENFLQRRNLLIEEYNNKLNNIESLSDLIAPHDYMSKFDLTIDKFETLYEKNNELYAQFEELSNITPKTADEAKAISETMDTLSKDIAENNKELLLYEDTMGKLAMESIANSIDDVTKAFENQKKALNNASEATLHFTGLETNLDVLGLNVNPLIKNVDEIEKKRSYYETALAEQEKFQSKSLESQRVYLNLLASEQAEDIQTQREDLIEQTEDLMLREQDLVDQLIDLDNQIQEAEEDMARSYRDHLLSLLQYTQDFLGQMDILLSKTEADDLIKIMTEGGSNIDFTPTDDGKYKVGKETKNQPEAKENNQGEKSSDKNTQNESSSSANKTNNSSTESTKLPENHNLRVRSTNMKGTKNNPFTSRDDLDSIPDNNIEYYYKKKDGTVVKVKRHNDDLWMMGKNNWFIPMENNYATGTPYHKGGKALLGDENFLKGKNTPSPELLIYPNGKIELVGENGPVIRDLPQGTEVLTTAQTKQLFKNIPSFANGTENITDISISNNIADVLYDSSINVDNVKENMTDSLQTLVDAWNDNLAVEGTEFVLNHPVLNKTWYEDKKTDPNYLVGAMYKNAESSLGLTVSYIDKATKTDTELQLTRPDLLLNNKPSSWNKGLTDVMVDKINDVYDSINTGSDRARINKLNAPDPDENSWINFGEKIAGYISQGMDNGISLSLESDAMNSISGVGDIELNDGVRGGSISSSSSDSSGDALVDAVEQYLGVPYVYGGTSPKGFDCSGLMQYVHNQQGISIPRTADAQWRGNGQSIDKKDLQVGDLVFFNDSGNGKNKVTHVGMYVGNNEMIHAPHTGDVVKRSSIDSSYYSKRYVGAKRYHDGGSYGGSSDNGLNVDTRTAIGRLIVKKLEQYGIPVNNSNISGTFDDEWGSISAKYEVGGNNPGAISNTKGDKGGKSYGIPQFSLNSGSLKAFVNWLNKQYPSIGNQLKGGLGSAEFDKSWKNIASNFSNFGSIQKEFGFNYFVKPINNKIIKKYGLDMTQSRALYEALVSMAYQYNNLSTSLLSGYKKGMTDREIIDLIYSNKRNNVNSHFKSSSSDVRASVANRIKNEYNDVLQYLYTGTPYHKGGKALLGDENFLKGKNTPSPELLIYPNGEVELVGENGPVIKDLPQGTEVLTTAQTKQLFKNIPHYDKGTEGYKETRYTDELTEIKDHNEYKIINPATLEELGLSETHYYDFNSMENFGLVKDEIVDQAKQWREETEEFINDKIQEPMNSIATERANTMIFKKPTAEEFRELSYESKDTVDKTRYLSLEKRYLNDQELGFILAEGHEWKDAQQALIEKYNKRKDEGASEEELSIIYEQIMKLDDSINASIQASEEWLKQQIESITATKNLIKSLNDHTNAILDSKYNLGIIGEKTDANYYDIKLKNNEEDQIEARNAYQSALDEAIGYYLKQYEDKGITYEQAKQYALENDEVRALEQDLYTTEEEGKAIRQERYDYIMTNTERKKLFNDFVYSIMGDYSGKFITDRYFRRSDNGVLGNILAQIGNLEEQLNDPDLKLSHEERLSKIDEYNNYIVQYYNTIDEGIQAINDAAQKAYEKESSLIENKENIGVTDSKGVLTRDKNGEYYIDNQYYWESQAYELKVLEKKQEQSYANAMLNAAIKAKATNPNASEAEINQIVKMDESVIQAENDLYDTRQKIVETEKEELDYTATLIENEQTLLELKKSERWTNKQNIEEFYDSNSALIRRQISRIKAYLEVANLSREEYNNTLMQLAELEKELFDNDTQKLKDLQEFYDSQYSSMEYMVNEYIDALNDEKDAISEVYEEEIDKLKEVNDQKERSIKLTELQNALDNAKKEKKRVYRAGVGFVYEEDREKINEAEKALDDFYKQDRISSLEKAKDLELKALDERIKGWNKYLEAIEKVYKTAERHDHMNRLEKAWDVRGWSGIWENLDSDLGQYLKAEENGDKIYYGSQTEFLGEYIGISEKIYKRMDKAVDILEYIRDYEISEGIRMGKPTIPNKVLNFKEDSERINKDPSELMHKWTDYADIISDFSSLAADPEKLKKISEITGFEWTADLAWGLHTQKQNDLTNKANELLKNDPNQGMEYVKQILERRIVNDTGYTYTDVGTLYSFMLANLQSKGNDELFTQYNVPIEDILQKNINETGFWSDEYSRDFLGLMQFMLDTGISKFNHEFFDGLSLENINSIRREKIETAYRFGEIDEQTKNDWIQQGENIIFQRDINKTLADSNYSKDFLGLMQYMLENNIPDFNGLSYEDINKLRLKKIDTAYKSGEIDEQTKNNWIEQGDVLPFSIAIKEISKAGFNILDNIIDFNYLKGFQNNAELGSIRSLGEFPKLSLKVSDGNGVHYIGSPEKEPVDHKVANTTTNNYDMMLLVPNNGTDINAFINSMNTVNNQFN